MLVPLDFSSFSQIRGAHGTENELAQGISAALRSLSCLETLVMPRGREDNFESLKGIATGCGGSLTALGLQRSHQLCPWAAALLATGLPKLRTLDLSHVEHLPGDAIVHLCSLKSLTDLDQKGTGQLRQAEWGRFSAYLSTTLPASAPCLSSV